MMLIDTLFSDLQQLKKVEVMLQAVSAGGVGFEVRKGKDARLLKMGQEISLLLKWNSAIIPNSMCKVQNVNGIRIGVMAPPGDGSQLPI